MVAQRARKFKKVQAKKLVKSNKSNFFRDIAFLAVLNFFPSSKIDFWPFLKWQKNRIWSKNFSWNWFISWVFLAWTFSNFVAHKIYVLLQQPSKVIGYQCSICLRKFLHLGTHCNHATNAHQMPGLQPVEVEMKPRYTCKQPRCGKHFMTKVIILFFLHD